MFEAGKIGARRGPRESRISGGRPARNKERADVLSVTQTSAPRRAARAAWRDAIKEDQRLGRDAVLIGLLMADYLKDDDPEPLWAVVDVLLRQSRMSRAALYRAQAELRECGYLWQVESAKPGRAPRWLPTVPTIIPAPRKSEDSHTENPSSQTENRLSHTETRNHTQTSSTPDVRPKGLDCESPPIFPAKPTTSRERADYELLRAHMHNFNEEAVATVYAWLRTGARTGRDGKRGKGWEWPGATAQKKHAQPTKVEGISVWQGFFCRAILGDKTAAPPKVRVIGDPWKT